MLTALYIFIDRSTHGLTDTGSRQTAVEFATGTVHSHVTRSVVVEVVVDVDGTRGGGTALPCLALPLVS